MRRFLLSVSLACLVMCFSCLPKAMAEETITFEGYFIGHYSPAGNHFFAYALKDHLVDWLDPKPLPYRNTSERIIDFKGYLRDY